MISSILICLAYMAFLAGLCLCAFRLGSGKSTRDILLVNKWNKSVILFFALGGLLLSIHLIIKNNYVYCWDYGTYWTYSYTTMEDVFNDPFQTVNDVYQTVLDSEYNKLLPLYVALPLKAFGYSFARYVVLNYLLFLVPAWIIIASIVWKVLLQQNPRLKDGKKSIVITAIIMLCISTFNAFLYPVLYGFIDVGCLIPAQLSILLFIDYDCFSVKKKQIARDLLIAAMLLMTFLFRRYFAFYIVGYAFALCTFSVYQCLKARKCEGFKYKCRNTVINLLIIGGTSLLVLLLFFNNLVFRILSNNYAEAYSAYNTDFASKCSMTVSLLGSFVLLLASAAVIMCLITRKARKITLFCGISSISTTLSFFYVQKMGAQHIYIIAGQVCVLMILGIWQIVEFVRNKKLKNVVCIVLSLLLVMGSLNCFIKKARPFMSAISGIYSQTYEPLKRSDIKQLQNLVTYANELTAPKKHVYVCASGFVLNESILQRLNAPYDSNALKRRYKASNVDSRDGFSTNFLKADYIIVSDPVQLHMKEGTQEVVRFLSEEVKNQDSPVGRHYSRLDKSFKLDNGVVANVYEKTSEYEQSDLQYLADYYSNRYPGKEEMFADRILSYSSSD